jgi:hypothetical protein
VEKYPEWICHACATELKGRIPTGHIVTWHLGTCGVCKNEISVTEPRGYGYPSTDLKNKIRVDYNL